MFIKMQTFWTSMFLHWNDVISWHHFNTFLFYNCVFTYITFILGCTESRDVEHLKKLREIKSNITVSKNTNVGTGTSIAEFKELIIIYLTEEHLIAVNYLINL